MCLVHPTLSPVEPARAKLCVILLMLCVWVRVVLSGVVDGHWMTAAEYAANTTRAEARSVQLCCTQGRTACTPPRHRVRPCPRHLQSYSATCGSQTHRMAPRPVRSRTNRRFVVRSIQTLWRWFAVDTYVLVLDFSLSVDVSPAGSRPCSATCSLR
jgi:hypothetical protein